MEVIQDKNKMEKNYKYSHCLEANFEKRVDFTNILKPSNISVFSYN